MEKTIQDVVTGEITQVALSKDELKALEFLRAEAAKKASEIAAVQQSKAAILERLGITAEEAALLLA